MGSSGVSNGSLAALHFCGGYEHPGDTGTETSTEQEKAEDKDDLAVGEFAVTVTMSVVVVMIFLIIIASVLEEDIEFDGLRQHCVDPLQSGLNSELEMASLPVPTIAFVGEHIVVNVNHVVDVLRIIGVVNEDILDLATTRLSHGHVLLGVDEVRGQVKRFRRSWSVDVQLLRLIVHVGVVSLHLNIGETVMSERQIKGE